MLTEVEEGSHGPQSPPTEWQVRLFLILKALVPVSLPKLEFAERQPTDFSETQPSPPSPQNLVSTPFLASWSPFFILVLQDLSASQRAPGFSLILCTTSHPILGTGPHISFSSSFCQARLFASPKGRLFNNCLSSPHPHALPSPARPAAGACIHPTLPGLAPQACKQRLHPRDRVGASSSPAIYLRTKSVGVTHSRAPPALLSSSTRS